VISRTTARRPDREERKASGVHRRGAVVTHRRQRPSSAGLRRRHVRTVREARWSDAHQHPEFRLPDKVLEDETQIILDMGVDVRYNSPITSMRSLLGEGSTRYSSASARRGARNSIFPDVTTNSTHTSSSASTGSNPSRSVTSPRSGRESSSSASATPPWTAVARRVDSAAPRSRSWRDAPRILQGVTVGA